MSRKQTEKNLNPENPSKERENVIRKGTIFIVDTDTKNIVKFLFILFLFLFFYFYLFFFYFLFSIFLFLFYFLRRIF
jgi:hypothetical protein